METSTLQFKIGFGLAALPWLTTIVFIALKMNNKIDWSWFWVWSPLAIPGIILVAAVLLACCIYFFYRLQGKLEN